LVVLILLVLYFRREGLAGRLELDEYVQRRLTRRRRRASPNSHWRQPDGE
jgi:hypothetical protein